MIKSRNGEADLVPHPRHDKQLSHHLLLILLFSACSLPSLISLFHPLSEYLAFLSLSIIKYLSPFLAMGGFDEAYHKPTIEDIDFGYRLKKAGYRIQLLKELQVKHLKHWEVKSLLKADILYRALPWTNLILNEGRFIDDLNVNLSGRLSVICTFILLLTTLGTFWIPWLLVPAVVCMMGLLLINRDLYRFFLKKRGPIFAAKAIPWHWAYFFYSGLAFAIGLTKHWLKKFSIFSF